MAAVLLLLLLFAGPASSSDADNLLLLKQSLSNPSSLSSWSPSSPSPCDARAPWTGVICSEGVVTGLRLESLSLTGVISVDALEKFPSLRTLSFSNNSLSGPIPSLNRLEALKALYLNRNKFSGQIPLNFFDTLRHLKKLHIDSNEFTGHIPSSVSSIPTLIELRLDNNRFSGPIPPQFSGKFDASSFSGNPGLCGPPLDAPCGQAAGNWKVVAAVVVAIAIASSVVAAGAVGRRKQDRFDTLGINNMKVEEGSTKKAAAAPAAAEEKMSANANGMDLVMVNEEKGVFTLSDLMKAAAEVLGNGGFGSAYKAVMGNGAAVAVKRMRDMNRVGKETFDLELRRLGRLRHKNLLTPLAYYYRREEKLLIFEFVPKGSLLYNLHGEFSQFCS